MDIGPKIKEFVTTWAPITKVLVSIVIVSATVSTLYAKIDNRLDNNKASIDCITKNTEEMDIEVDKFKAAMIKQTEQLKNISQTLERIEKQLDRLEVEKKDK